MAADLRETQENQGVSEIQIDKLESIDVSKYLSYTAFHYAFYILPSYLLLYSQSVS